MTSGRRCSPRWPRSARSLMSARCRSRRWAPLAFELADALLLFAIFRLLSATGALPYLAVGLYEGLIAWVGQDYFSPQAFGFLLWLAMAYDDPALAAGADHGSPTAASCRIGRVRARVLSGMAPRRRDPGAALRGARARRRDLLRDRRGAPAHPVRDPRWRRRADADGSAPPRWLLLLLAAVAIAYLIPRYGLISSNFGGLFSGGSPLQNASGSRGTYNAGGEALTAQIVHYLAAAMWLLALGAVARRRKTLGRVLIPALLAFSPFLILGAQSYGGEAIYRVYLFSAPWCALLIAGLLLELRMPGRGCTIRWPLTAVVCLAALFAGLQGLYGLSASMRSQALSCAPASGSTRTPRKAR